jgi:crotonobetainyl-CoA:carnitine CoA-transferase CaiB-like acyl-CoA transferase
MSDSDQALSGMTVVVIGGVAPLFCGRWLAAFGAEVVAVELAEHAWLRRYCPIGGAVADDEPGPLFTYLTAGMQRLALDPAAHEDRTRLQALAAQADLLVHDLPPAGIRGFGLGLGAATAPLEVALTPFGTDGPYAGFAGASNVLLALGGFQFLSGEPGRAPLALPGFQPEYLTGLYGVVAALSGLLARGRRRGGRIELSALEALATLHQFTLSLYQFQGVIRGRHGNRWQNLYPITMLPCRDGWLGFAITAPDQWERLCVMIERPDLLDDPRFASSLLRREHADDLDAILTGWLHDQDKMAVFHRAQEEWRLPIGPLLTLEEVLDDPQYAARGYWRRPDGDSGPVHPGWPVAFGPPPSPAGAVEGEAHPVAAKHVLPSPAPAGEGPGVRADPVLPLAGLRVLDFTRVWAGPLCTRILADLGAEVIKIEAPLTPVDAANAAAAVSFARTVGFSKLNRNKQSLVIDLRRAQGRALVRRLVEKSDVLVENFSARVMPNFGLDYPALSAINPALVMLAMPGFGATGPYRSFMSYGPAIEPMTGLTSLMGYPGEAPLVSAIAYPDAVGGLSAAAAVVTALVERRRTGRGCFIDLSQLEATTSLIGEYYLAYQATGTLPERIGNGHPLWAPHGTYRCQGEDAWVSIAVRSDAEWQRFCAAAGLDELGAAPELMTAAGRRAHQARIDRAIETWTRGRDKFAVMAALQRAGVPAGAVVNAPEMLADPQLAARGFYADVSLPDGTPLRMAGVPFTFDGMRRQTWQAAPERGAHNRQVLRDVLAMSDGEIDALIADGVLVDGIPVLP